MKTRNLSDFRRRAFAVDYLLKSVKFDKPLNELIVILTRV